MTDLNALLSLNLRKPKYKNIIYKSKSREISLLFDFRSIKRMDKSRQSKSFVDNDIFMIYNIRGICVYLNFNNR